jgi:two-component sensor histidine kinase
MSAEAPVQLQPHDLAFRQLRHNTRNTLQRIIYLLTDARELSAFPGGSALAQDLIGRICSATELADSLYAITQPYGGMAARLQTLSRSLVRLYGARTQEVEIKLIVELECDGQFADVVLQIAHELVGNALKHGLRGQPGGEIEISLTRNRAGSVILAVTDSGNGFVAEAKKGEGLCVAQELADVYQGRIIMPAPGEEAKVLARFPAGVPVRNVADVAELEEPV